MTATKISYFTFIKINTFYDSMHIYKIKVLNLICRQVVYLNQLNSLFVLEFWTRFHVADNDSRTNSFHGMITVYNIILWKAVYIYIIIINLIETCLIFQQYIHTDCLFWTICLYLTTDPISDIFKYFYINFHECFNSLCILIERFWLYIF